MDFERQVVTHFSSLEAFVKNSETVHDYLKSLAAGEANKIKSTSDKVHRTMVPEDYVVEADNIEVSLSSVGKRGEIIIKAQVNLKEVSWASSFNPLVSLSHDQFRNQFGESFMETLNESLDAADQLEDQDLEA